MQNKYTIAGLIALVIVVAGIWWYNAANPGSPSVPNTGTDNSGLTATSSSDMTAPAMDPNAKG